jgi:ribosome-associated heat shock protein Hsp15
MSRHAAAAAPAEAADLRLDKWLWAARFYKTRALATDEIAHGRVQVNGADAKPSRTVRVGDTIAMRQPGFVRTVNVLGLSAVRGPAPQARLLYEETAESIAAQQRAAEARRQGVEPAAAIDAGRPTKRDRRELTDWQRWSASLDDD